MERLLSLESEKLAVGEGGWIAVASGWHTRIEPMRAGPLASPQDFDTRMTALTGERRAELDALEHD